VRHGREGGAVTSAIDALFLLGNDAYFTGRWDELTPLVDEGLALCDELGVTSRGALRDALSDHKPPSEKPDLNAQQP
jgi:hypothetical protein